MSGLAPWEGMSSRIVRCPGSRGSTRSHRDESMNTPCSSTSTGPAASGAGPVVAAAGGPDAAASWWATREDMAVLLIYTAVSCHR